MPSHQERPPTMKPSKNKSWQDVVSLPLTRQQSSTSGLISPEPTLEPGLMPCSVSQNAGCNLSGSPWLKLWSLSHPLTPEQPDPATGGDDHSRARHRFRSPTVPRGKMTPKVSHSLSWILCPLFSTRLPMRAWAERGWPPEILLEPGATSREREPKTQPGAAHVLFSSQRQPHLLSHWMTELSLWSPTKYPAPRMTWWCTWPTHTPWAVTSGTTSTLQV